MMPSSLPRRLVRFAGLANTRGDLSFNKMVTVFMLGVYTYTIHTGRNPSPWVLSFGVVLVGAGFGLKGYLAGAGRATLRREDAADVIKPSL